MKIKADSNIPHFFGDEVKKFISQYNCWLTCAVHRSIAWPENDLLIQYDGDFYLLKGLQGSEKGSIVVPVKSIQESDENTNLKRVNKFCSILGWFKRGYVDVVEHGSGGWMTKGGGKQRFDPPKMPYGYEFSCNDMPVVENEKTRIALAFWKEGEKLKSIHVGYSFLGFFKVIESQLPTQEGRKNWINGEIPKLTGEAKTRIDELKSSKGSFDEVGKYIWESCRCAVAHASSGREIVDPDISEDKIRLKRDLKVIRSLAEKYIGNELGVLNDRGVSRVRQNQFTFLI